MAKKNEKGIPATAENVRMAFEEAGVEIKGVRLTKAAGRGVRVFFETADGVSATVHFKYGVIPDIIAARKNMMHTLVKKARRSLQTGFQK
jgi:hypothetical protein